MSADENGPRRLAILSAAEPATRVLNAVAELSRSGGREYHTIALFPERDRRAWYVRSADEAVVHRRRSARPGGVGEGAHLLPRRRWCGSAGELLPRTSDFVRLCERSGITFVGPSAARSCRGGRPDLGEAPGRSRPGSPVVPWSGEAVKSPADAEDCAARLGYPLLVKAAAGGGRQRIRIAADPAELAEAVSRRPPTRRAISVTRGCISRPGCVAPVRSRCSSSPTPEATSGCRASAIAPCSAVIARCWRSRRRRP